MKRCNENPFIPFDPYIIPDDIYGAIYQHLSPKSKNAFSQVDKHLLKLCSHLATSICFLPPKSSSNPPENIYQVLLARYPHIQKLTIESDRPVYLTKNIKQLCDFIDFLNANEENHPLSHVKELDIQELEWDVELDLYRPLHKQWHKDLNKRLLSSLSHNKLESFVWKTLNSHDVTPLSFLEIQPILEKAVELKDFKIDGILDAITENFYLSFEKQTKLVSACVGLSKLQTVLSLKGCSELESLDINCNTICPTVFTPAFKNQAWNLKRLKLSLQCSDFQFNEQMPHLEILNLYRSALGDQSPLEDLGINCPKLRELRLDHISLSEEGIARLLQGLSNLEVFIFEADLEITEEIMGSITQNCPKINSFMSEMISPNRIEWTFYSEINGIPNNL